MSHRRERWYTITQRVLSSGAVKRVYVVSCSKCGRQGERHAGMVTDDMRRKDFMREGWEIGRWKNLHVCPQCAGNAPAPPEVEVEEPALPEPAQPKTWMDDLPKLQQAWNLTYEDEHLAFIAWLRDTYGDRYLPGPAAPKPAPAPTLQELFDASSKEQQLQSWRWLHDNYSFSSMLGVEKKPTPVPRAEVPRAEVDEFLRQIKEGAKQAPLPPVQPHPANREQQHGTHIDSMPVQAPLPPIANPPTVDKVEIPPEPVEADDGAEDWYRELMEKQKQQKQKQGRTRK